MPDPKKDGKKDAKSGGGESGPGGEVEVLFWAIIFIVVVLVVTPAILKFFGYNISLSSISLWWTGFSFSAERAFSAFFSGLIFVSIFLCLLFVIGVMYAKFKVGQIGHEQAASIERPGETGGQEQAAVSQISSKGPPILPTNLPGSAGGELMFAPSAQNQKWLEIQKHMESGNQAEWRLAILEADIMLYDMLEQMGYEGDSIGEKLKKVESASFNTLNEAWSAHKVRNIIAHEGASYILPRGEAERTMRQFEAVFKEFYFI
ncbi:MAG: hypothetical protein V4664_02555 [Patescibacteria group bacterium]